MSANFFSPPAGFDFSRFERLQEDEAVVKVDEFSGFGFGKEVKMLPEKPVVLLYKDQEDDEPFGSMGQFGGAGGIGFGGGEEGGAAAGLGFVLGATQTGAQATKKGHST